MTFFKSYLIAIKNKEFSIQNIRFSCAFSSLKAMCQKVIFSVAVSDAIISKYNFEEGKPCK